MNIWFMYDNHTFAKIAEKTRDGLINRAKELFREDGCGSLFVRDEMGGELSSLCLNGRLLSDRKWGVLPDELEIWANSVEVERSFRTLMA